MVHSPMRSPMHHPREFWYIHQCVHPCITPVNFLQVSAPIQTNHLLTTCLTQSERASIHTCCWYQCRIIWKIIETAPEPNHVAADLHRELLDSSTSSGSSRLVADGDLETLKLCCCLQLPSFSSLIFTGPGGYHDTL